MVRWDMRQKSDSPSFNIIAHSSEIFSLDFNPFNEFIFLTGSGDNSACLWDLRNLTEPLHRFDGHKKGVIFKLSIGSES